MGYKINKQDLLNIDNTLFSFDVDNSDTSYFEIPLPKSDDYTKLKDKIYKLDIDNEEKANILNKISLLNNNISIKERKQIEEEIKQFKEKYL